MQQVNLINMRGCIEDALANGVGIKGFAHTRVYDLEGNLVKDFGQSNLVVLAGRRWVLQQIISTEINTAQAISWLAVGTGTTAPSTADTALGSEVLRKQVQSYVTSNLTSNPPSFQIHVSFASNEANTTLGELGLFITNSGAPMMARSLFSSTINKTTSNVLSIVYTISN